MAGLEWLANWLSDCSFVGFPGRTRFCALILAGAAVCSGQSFISELKAEHDLGRRSEKALVFADLSFDTARDLYKLGDVHKGDAELENMTAALTECMESVSALHKARLYKRAELRVAYLQRRLENLVDSLSLQERGWAEQTSRNLEDLHERLLEGVMRK